MFVLTVLKAVLQDSDSLIYLNKYYQIKKKIEQKYSALYLFKLLYYLFSILLIVKSSDKILIKYTLKNFFNAYRSVALYS